MRVEIVVSKLEETKMYGTKSDAQLEPCFLPSAPFSPPIPRIT